MDFYRKKAVDNSSSIENIDKAIVVTPPSTWLSIIVGVVIIAIVLIWSIFGKLPTKITSNGIYVPEQNIYVVSSEITGVIETVEVEPNQKIDIGDVLYTVDDKDLLKEKEKIEERVKTVESITISSKDDIVNSDTQSLLEIKLQMESGKSTLAQNNKLLDLKKNEKINLQSSVDNAKKDYNNAQKSVEDLQNKLTKAKTDYAEGSGITTIEGMWTDPQTEDYIKYINDYFPGVDPAVKPSEQVDKFSKAIETLTSKFTNANNNLADKSSDYSIAKQKLASAESEIDSISQQIDSGIAGDAVTRSQLTKQFDATKEIIIDSLKDELKKYEDLIEKNYVVSSTKGVVLDVKVSTGQMIAQGSNTVTIREIKDDDDIVICYVGITDGKKIKPGMQVKVYPSVASKFEYGNIEATVVSVDDYVTSLNTISSDLGADSLVQIFANAGPVIGVKCRLEKDETTASGYLWSSNKAKDIIIPQGTIVSADIITEEKRPISMLIPFIKEKISNINDNTGQK